MRSRRLASTIATVLIVAACGASAPSSPPAPLSSPLSSPSSPPSSPPSTQTSGPSVPPSPSLRPAPTGVAFALPTFPWASTLDGTPIGCDTIGVRDPVYGHLAGSPKGRGPNVVWLDAPDGSDLLIVWPEGFEARFGPTLVIYDQTGGVVARAGDAVMLQVSRHDAAGTSDDPYYASGIMLAGSFAPDDLSTGIVFTGCYPRVPDIRPASWWVDPATLPLPASTRTIQGFIQEGACAGGQSPEGRILDPVIAYRSDAIEVTFTVAQQPGEQDCPGNPSFPVEIRLSEPLGTRALLDGSEAPPRDATTEP